MKKLNLFYYVIILATIISCKEEGDFDYPSVKNLTVDSSDDVTIHFTKYGNQDEAIVFVHGWSCDQTYWDDQIDFFKEDYQVVTVDLAGHGKSTQGTRDDWTIPSLSNDLLKVLECLNYDEVTLVGHSMGSMVVIGAATQLDEDQTKVVAVDYLKSPLVPVPEEIIEPFINAMIMDFENVTKGFVFDMFRSDADTTLRNSIMEDMSSAPESVAIPLAKDLATRDFSGFIEMLVEKEMQRYIINSDLSPIDESHYENLGFEMGLITETGHFVMIEKPLLFNQLLEESL